MASEVDQPLEFVCTRPAKRKTSIKIRKSIAPCAKDRKGVKGKKGKFKHNGCFPLCQTDRSNNRGNTPGKWNNIF